MRLLPLLLMVAGCSSAQGGPSAGESAMARELAGRTAGTAQDCIHASPAANLVARDKRTLVYRDADTIWVNRLEADCSGLGPLSSLTIERFGSDYCRGDRVRGLEPGAAIPGPYCPLGRFTPYRR